MQAEEAKILGPGAGLCPGKRKYDKPNCRFSYSFTGYTISRAILGDAVALTRGDPYLTTAMTPYNV
jgi:linoleate 10R-lipoxygenase